MTSRTPTFRRYRGAVAAASLALLFAACGSDSGELAASDEPTATTEQPPTTEAAVDDNGLPSLSGDDTADGSPSDSGEDADGQEADVPDPESAVEDYEVCLSEQGIDVVELESASQEEQEAIVFSAEFEAADAVCQPILEAAFADFELDPEFEAELSDRSADLAACGREILGVDIPDDILALPPDDPRVLELESIETTPDQDAAIEECFEDILGDLFDENGLPVTPEDQ